MLRVCSCDLKAISYFSSYLSLVADRKFKPEQHIKVLSNTRLIRVAANTRTPLAV